ncbi:helix-turn-helix transcriptional regulator [Methylomonas sp. DH-1]|uniref:helix-turn-helix domain-containing protein n=1 Tax=Methylomonas sp. (strain DH-1) TaxID=1727196 RepID=UPI0007C935E8|nr:helix-turn-helix transcriptional regulator [Methylomonas sp. DH-1]ANE56180.1 hypothetical protein AYM39_13970 [Methylomonas sp. DH-1]
MSAHTNIQIINGLDGTPAFVALPYAGYLKDHVTEATTIPNEVIGAVIKQDITPIKAWREYLHLSTDEVAHQLGVCEAEYIDIENQKKLHKPLLKKMAVALNINIDQLNF